MVRLLFSDQDGQAYGVLQSNPRGGVDVVEGTPLFGLYVRDPKTGREMTPYPDGEGYLRNLATQYRSTCTSVRVEES